MDWLICILCFLVMHFLHRYIEDKLNEVIVHQRNMITLQKRQISLLSNIHTLKDKINENRNHGA